MVILNKIQDWLKNKVNSIRIPPLLSFIIKKDGTINPTLEEALEDAPPASENWARMALGKEVFGKVKVWHILILPVLMWAITKGAGALKFFIDIATNLVLLVPLAAILYFIYKQFFKK